MHLKNSKNHFGFLSIFLHWLMAFLIIGMLCLGLYMVSLPIGLEKLKLYGWHKEYGLLILVLAIFRLIWRLTNITPKLSLPWLGIVAARFVHWALYGLMFAMPISGWLLTSAAGFRPSFFGLFSLPGLVAPNEVLRPIFITVHEWIAYALIATICLHIAAALKHHFIDKDDILRRIISWK